MFAENKLCIDFAAVKVDGGAERSLMSIDRNIQANLKRHAPGKKGHHHKGRSVTVVFSFISRL